ncbi:uncharacterized protein N7483_012514 [Penicillium malachiteum]|uniref:uncharacterized protein n=1 Tax=Penicillium malachiteum TaxID=1324776 RepID=UPI002548E9BA|nr:uncharacterized protein N7483_012514 [Penicillium malachiteum]KAJ5715333.1 hypothetical protein N7483_012514 [Penicillium malachiteum]
MLKTNGDPVSGALRNTHKLTHDGIPHKPFACTFTGCRSRFKRRKALERHSVVHLGVKPYACWVPYYYRKFQRRDNLNAHYLTHGKRAGRNLYVATLDPASPLFDTGYRGRITPEEWPLDIQWPYPVPN